MTTLENILDKSCWDKVVLRALKTLENDFHTYSDEEGVVYEEDCLESSEWSWSSGVCKVCIILNDFVLKKAFIGQVTEVDWETGEMFDEPVFDNYANDMCALEYEVYLRAVEENLGNCFAEIVPLDCDIYAQEKIDVSLEDWIDNPDNEDKIPDFIDGLESIYSDIIFRIGKIALMIMLQTYGEDKVLRLQKFLIKYDINDLHTSNLGFNTDGELKIFDFCGFCSSTSERLSLYRV